jgi:DNA-binding XRE family transcriptional regulator
MEEQIESMDAEERARLQAGGWQFTSVTELLGLTPEEAAIIEIKLALTNELKQRRKTAKMTQTALATRIGSSQSRIAAIEAGRQAPSLDLLLQAVFAVGASPSVVGAIIERESERAGVGPKK